MTLGRSKLDRFRTNPPVITSGAAVNVPVNSTRPWQSMTVIGTTDMRLRLSADPVAASFTGAASGAR